MKKLIALALALFSPLAFADYAGHWWNPTEPGWGMAIQQQQDRVFFQLYTYTADGDPVWYIGSCKLEANLCPATLYVTDGGSPLPFYTKPTSAPAGMATFNFLTPDTAAFSFKIGDGVAWTKDIVKLAF